jgi:hypothetical protein
MSEAAQTTRAFPVSVKGVLVRDGQVLLLKIHSWFARLGPQRSATTGAFG